MANFHTHFVGATVVGVAINSLFIAVGFIDSNYFISGVMLVILGGILPDIDSDHSDSIKIIFDIMGVLLATILTLVFLPRLGILINSVIFVLLFLLFRFGSIIPFRHLTSHRGIFHSIPMGLIVSLITAYSCYTFLDITAKESWVSSFCVFIGFITHLILDESCSVNLAGATLKKSFGTALCFYNRNNPLGYLFLYLIIIILLFFVPNPNGMSESFLQSFTSAKWL